MLFYDISGTIQNISEMVITPREIFLRDIGTSVSTSFEYDEECMEFVERNNLFTSRHGMIHSHNVMAVFFSETDKNELQDNVVNHNVYLSLVVNNFMNMVAKTVFIGTPSPNFQCLDEDGNEYNLEMPSIDKIMFIYDCEIDMPQQDFEVDEEFKKNFSIIKKRTAEKAKALKESAQQPNLNKSVQQHANGANGYNSWGKSDGYGHSNFNSGSEKDFDFRNRLGAIEDIEPDDDPYDCDDFFAYCFNGGAHTPLDIIDLIIQVDLEKSHDIVIDQIISNYATYYENFYETEQFGTDEEEFRDCINRFLIMCDHLKYKYKWLETLEVGLRLICNKFEELNLNQPNTDDAEV